VIKLLCKQFNQSISHILVDNEPIVPAPCIKVTNEKFELYLDWNLIIRTTSPTTALALLLSLYNVFAIKFAKNNHTSHLLYAVFFQNGDELGKNLGIILNSWHFTFEDRIKHSQIQATNVIDSVDMASTSNLQVHPTLATTTTETIQSSIILNNEQKQSPISPQSIPLIIDDQEEHQPSDNPLMQEHEPEQMDTAIETPPTSLISSRIQGKSNTKTKSRTSSNSQNAALRDATNKEETSTALIKNKKRKLPPSPQRKQSSRLIAKRSRQNDSSF
ncbi:unnamed protein product, partial [Adineta steineri]